MVFEVFLGQTHKEAFLRPEIFLRKVGVGQTAAIPVRFSFVAALDAELRTSCDALEKTLNAARFQREPAFVQTLLQVLSGDPTVAWNMLKNFDD